MLRLFTFFLGFFSCLGAAAQAAQIAVPYSSGTGFYVSRQGHLITNAHVLDACEEITVVAGGTRRAAELLDKDKARDLALLKTEEAYVPAARLRHPDTPVERLEPVVVMGYPESARGLDGDYEVKDSVVRALQGPKGETQWIQFDDVARQGNSGGPLLDRAGNVVGVVTARATLFRRNELAARDEQIGQSDIAVAAPALRAYLEENGVAFEHRDSLLRLSGGQIERRGQEFIVRVLCRQGVETW